jgi:hypothetical protein
LAHALAARLNSSEKPSIPSDTATGSSSLLSGCCLA